VVFCGTAEAVPFPKARPYSKAAPCPRVVYEMASQYPVPKDPNFGDGEDWVLGTEYWIL